MQARTRFLPQKYDRGRIDEGPMHADCAWYCKEAFQEVIRREAVRSSRSGRSPLLLLFDVSVWESTQMTRKVTSVLSSSTREIDVKGWYTDGAIIGILFAEFGRMHNAVDAAREAIIGRLYDSLSGFLADEVIRIALYTLPAGLGAREGLPPPLMYDRRRKDAVS